MATKSTTKKAPAKRKAAKKPASRTAPAVTIEIPEQTEAQKQAKIQAYVTLKNAGLAIPPELALEVEALVAASQRREEQRLEAEQKARTAEQRQIEQENKDGPEWVRNCYNAPFSLRLERQDEKKKKIELKARGQRGDMFPLQENDINDQNLQANLETGLIEVIPNGVAKSILTKQTKNIHKTHTPLAVLRNEKGDPYAPDAVKMEVEYNKQGVVVAVTDPNVDPHNDKQVGKHGGIVRSNREVEQVAQFVPTGGNPAIISSGFAGPEAQARIADDIARRKGVEGPKAAGILSVTIDPVQKS